MGARSPIIRELDVPAAVLRHLAAARPDRYPVLLDSAAAGPLGRFSVLHAQPRAALWVDGAGRPGMQGVSLPHGDFLSMLEHWWRAERETEPQAAVPFTGGWAIFLGYELAEEIEPRLRLPPSSLPWRALALRTPCALVHDRSSDLVFAVGESGAGAELDQVCADALKAADAAPPEESSFEGVIEEEAPDAFLWRVRRAKEYIRAGDIYQANLSRPWRMRLAGAPDIGQLYRRLCAENPAPFAALAQWNGVAILSSSPERLVQVTGDDVQTRPIAGTRPRSRSPEDDARLMAELVAHPKERAEHIMLIDLERNDLGRICEAGTVRVDELMCIESYAHVHHIVSNVRGRLRADVTPLGAVRAVFPGGTITGCPKFRCMQIIAELEGEGRGAYTGSLGYLTRGGSLDLNILIRTMTVMEQRLELRAGAGIVADSIPERELEETRAKARGLLASLEPVSRAATAV